MRRKVSLLADEIRRYAIAHPDARDTIDGIVWWVHIQREQEAKTNVANAVGHLVRNGVLQQWTLADGSAVFGLA